MELVSTDNPYLFKIEPYDAIQKELRKRDLEIEDISHAVGISVGRIVEIIERNLITAPEFFKIESEFDRRDAGLGVLEKN